MSKGAPIGNTNASRGTEWRNAIRRAIEKYQTKTIKRGMALEAIAERVVKDALSGDMDAIHEIGNRLDGKPTTPVEFEGDPDTMPRIILYLPDNSRGPTTDKTSKPKKQGAKKP